jgi:catechol 2,3-dioxygenase-like lactoylglutathione lyase family enzyme
MKPKFQATRDVIIRTAKWAEATKFYSSVLGLPVTLKNKKLIGFEAGAFCLYLEKGKEHGPVFEFLVPNVDVAQVAVGRSFADSQRGRVHASP